MSYFPTGSVFEPTLTRAQKTALQPTPTEIRQFTPNERMEYLMRSHEVSAEKTRAFWEAIGAFATAGIPILVFLGVVGRGRK